MSMAITTRQKFKEYILRRLGSPVIDINVDDEQVEDRIDDALLKFRDYHFDGMQHVYYPHQLTEADRNNEYITLPDDFVGVTHIFDINDSYGAMNLFNVRYQLHLNELFNISSVSVTPYVVAMRHIEFLEEVFVGKKPIRYNRNTDKLYIDMNWKDDTIAGQYVIIDGYREVNPEEYPDVWDEPWLKQYATALVKRQWGEHLKLYEGMNLPGGITFNGQKIWDEATEEIQKLEDTVINDYSLPVTDMIG
jgi:hypothetical protein